MIRKQIYLPKELERRLSVASKQQRISEAELVREALEDKLGEGLMSAVRLERSGTWDHWCICNDRGDPPPGLREKRLVALLHDWVAQMIERRELTRGDDRSTAGLSAKRLKLLALVLEGRAEKEIAAAMSRSLPTVHEHIQCLYHHFGVNGRAQLMAYFLRHRAAPDPTRRPPLSSPQAWLVTQRKVS